MGEHQGVAILVDGHLAIGGQAHWIQPDAGGIQWQGGQQHGVVAGRARHDRLGKGCFHHPGVGVHRPRHTTTHQFPLGIGAGIHQGAVIGHRDQLEVGLLERAAGGAEGKLLGKGRRHHPGAGEQREVAGEAAEIGEHHPPDPQIHPANPTTGPGTGIRVLPENAIPLDIVSAAIGKPERTGQDVGLAQQEIEFRRIDLACDGGGSSARFQRLPAAGPHHLLLQVDGLIPLLCDVILVAVTL